jgi:hypothetical protein
MGALNEAIQDAMGSGNSIVDLTIENSVAAPTNAAVSSIIYSAIYVAIYESIRAAIALKLDAHE